MTDEQITTMLVDNPREIFARRAATEVADETPPIGTQVAALAAADPDAPAITCSGQTLTRRELELSRTGWRVPSPSEVSASATT